MEFPIRQSYGINPAQLRLQTNAITAGIAFDDRIRIFNIRIANISSDVNTFVDEMTRIRSVPRLQILVNIFVFEPIQFGLNFLPFNRFQSASPPPSTPIS